MGISKNFNIDTFIKKLVTAAKEYDEIFCKKYFLIIYKKETTFYARTVYFDDINFLHLTGINTQLRPKVFYQACLSGKIAKKDITFDRTGKVQQKFAVLPYLKNIFFSHCMIGGFNSNGNMLRVDYLIGDTRNILSSGFVNINRSTDRPKTLLKMPIKQVTDPTYKIYAVYQREYKDKYFFENTYSAKDFCVNDIISTEIYDKYLKPR